MDVQRTGRFRLAGTFAAVAITLLATSCGGGSDDAAGSPSTAPSSLAPPTTADPVVAPTTAPRPTSTSPPPTTQRPSPTSTTVAPTTSTTTTTSPPQPRPTAEVDELVSVGGPRLHVRCTGSGPSTVLLIHGFTGDHTSFAGIEPQVAQMSRVCSYDRFGTGSSDPPPAPQTFATQAHDLRNALTALGEPGPFVVVGHSFGGDVAVTFTSLYRSEVAGLLLLEASPWNWNSTVCSVADDGSASAEIWVQTCSMQAGPASNVEGIDGPAAFAELAQIGSLGDIPMIVDTASVHDYTAPDFDPAVAAGLTEAWFAGQDHWASLSSNSQVVHVDNAGHNVHVDQPELVIEQITELLSPLS